jgi:hypothetical protein
MRVAIHGLVAVSIALMPAGYAEAAKKKHAKVHYQAYRSYPVADPYAYPYGPQAPMPRYIPRNAAVEGNNANSMSGSNSAPANAIGRSSGGGFH